MPPVLIRSALVVIGALALAGAARAATVEVVVVPVGIVQSRAGDGAIGLMPPGDGGGVSRAGAIAALVRGKTRKSLLGGHATGKRLIRLGRKPERTSRSSSRCRRLESTRTTGAIRWRSSATAIAAC